MNVLGGGGPTPLPHDVFWAKRCVECGAGEPDTWFLRYEDNGVPRAFLLCDECGSVARPIDEEKVREQRSQRRM